MNKKVLMTFLIATLLVMTLVVGVSAIQCDYVDIGVPSSEAGHDLQDGWGPVERATHGGNWGGGDDGTIRVVWYNPNTNPVQGIPTDPLPDGNPDSKNGSLMLSRNGCYNAPLTLKIRALDGTADDSFVVTIDVIGESGKNTFSYTAQGRSNGETWITHEFDLDPSLWGDTSFRVIITASCESGPNCPWSGFDTYGQLGISWVSLEGTDADLDTTITGFTYYDQDSDYHECNAGLAWIDYEDFVVTHGVSESSSGISDLSNLQYGWDVVPYPWSKHIESPQSLPSNSVEWYTAAARQVPILTPGHHRVCGRILTDNGGNHENSWVLDVWDAPDDDCCDVCVDKGEENAPVSEKEVGYDKTPAYGKGDFFVTDFVTDETLFALTCEDWCAYNEDAGYEIPGSGCFEIWYRIKYCDGNENCCDEQTEGTWSGEWISYDDTPFTLGDIDGYYCLEWYSVDNAGNEEEYHFQEHKLDNIIPDFDKTEKVYLGEDLSRVAYGECKTGLLGLQSCWEDSETKEQACFIWHDDPVGGLISWHIRCVADLAPGQGHRIYKGVIKTTGEFVSVTENYFPDSGNGDKWLVEDPEVLAFEMHVDGATDGFDFTIQEEEKLAFEIWFEGELDPQKIYLGENKVNPDTNPFMWPQSRWVGKGTEFTITAEDDESGVDSIWWWLVNGLSGYKNGFSEGGDKVTFNLTDPNYHVCGFGPWKIEYWAVDNLDNGFTKSEPPIEWAKSQLVLLDNIEPEIEILQPLNEEALIGCGANIVSVEAEITDVGVGVNPDTVYAQLWKDGVAVGDEVNMTYYELTGVWKANILHGGYEADTDYEIRVFASDYVGNQANNGEGVGTPIELDYDVFFTWEETYVTVKKGETIQMNVHVKNCHGGNAIGMKMSKLCGNIDLNPRLIHGDQIYGVDQVGYFNFIYYTFSGNWDYMNLTDNTTLVGAEADLVLEMDIPEDMDVSGTIGCMYLFYKFAAAPSGSTTLVEPFKPWHGIGRFIVSNEGYAGEESSTVTFSKDGAFIPPMRWCGDGTCNNGETCGNTDDWPECKTDCGVCSVSTPQATSSGGGGGGGGSPRTAEDTTPTFLEENPFMEEETGTSEQGTEDDNIGITGSVIGNLLKKNLFPIIAGVLIALIIATLIVAVAKKKSKKKEK